MFLDLLLSFLAFFLILNALLWGAPIFWIIDDVRDFIRHRRG